MSIRIWTLRAVIIVCGLLAVVMPARSGTDGSRASDKVAIVNGVPIFRDEFNGEVLVIQKTLIGLGKPLTCNQVTAVQKDVLEGMIRQEIIYQESLAAGIKPDEKAVDKALKGLRQQFASEAEYKEELRRRNLSDDKLRSRLERNSAIQQFIQRYAANVSVTDSDAVNYYGSHLDSFMQPLQVRASHIFIKSDQGTPKGEARRKAERILKELRGGKDFAALARQESDGPTRAEGGDLGYVKTGQLEKQLETVVFGLKTGETSDIVETANGFHIFKAVDRKPETVLAFDDVKGQIRQHLIEEKAKQEAELRAGKLREKVKVEILLDEETCTAKRS